MSAYFEACHAMQSGVAAKMNYDPTDTEPKHLRVGINSAMSDHAGLVQLLMDKGIITVAEYEEALTKAMQNEVQRYEKWLRDRTGGKITLG